MNNYFKIAFRCCLYALLDLVLLGVLNKNAAVCVVIRRHGNCKKSLFNITQRERDYTEKLHKNKVE